MIERRIARVIPSGKERLTPLQMGCILICMEKQATKQLAIESRRTISVPAQPDSPRRISSATLLQGQRHVVIEHVGREYRLHLTAKGKLILTG